MVTRTGSPSREEARGCALLWRQEIPSIVQYETVNLSEEEDSLSEAQWQVSSEEEPPMEMTSRSTRGS